MITNGVAYNTDIVCSQCWEPDVQNQGVGRAMLPPEALGASPILPLPASGVCRCITLISASVVTWPFLLHLPYVDLPLPFSGALVIGFRTHPDLSK